MIRARWLALALLPLAAALLACAGAPGRLASAPPAAEREAYAAAMAPLPRDPAGAERRLSEFLQRYPESSLADDAGLELGRIALARGDKQTALARLRAVVERYPGGDRSDSARVELAQLEAARGNKELAASELGRVRIAKLPPEERRVAYRVLADTTPDPVASLRWRARLRAEETDPERIARIDAELDRALDGFSAADLDRAAEQLGDQTPAARALARRAELALAQGDPETARRAWESARRRTLAGPDAARVASVGERIARSERGFFDTADLPTFAQAAQAPLPDTAGATGTIGVVLPLSGSFAPFGEESLQGILLAAGLFDAASAGAGTAREAEDPRHRRASRAGRRGRARAGGGRRGLGDHRSAALGRERGGGRGGGGGAGAAARALLARGDRPRPQPCVPPAHDAAGGDRGAGRSHRSRPRRAALRDPLSARSLWPRRAQALLGGRRAGGRPRDRGRVLRSRGERFCRSDPAAARLLDAVRGRGVGARAARESRAARAAPAPPGRGQAARGGARADGTRRLAAPADRRLRRALHPGVVREGRADRAPARLPRGDRHAPGRHQRLVPPGPAGAGSPSRRGGPLQLAVLSGELAAERAGVRAPLSAGLLVGAGRLRGAGLRRRAAGAACSSPAAIARAARCATASSPSAASPARAACSRCARTGTPASARSCSASRTASSCR